MVYGIDKKQMQNMEDARKYRKQIEQVIDDLKTNPFSQETIQSRKIIQKDNVEGDSKSSARESILTHKIKRTPRQGFGFPVKNIIKTEGRDPEMIITTREEGNKFTSISRNQLKHSKTNPQPCIENIRNYSSSIEQIKLEPLEHNPSEILEAQNIQNIRDHPDTEVLNQSKSKEVVINIRPLEDLKISSFVDNTKLQKNGNEMNMNHMESSPFPSPGITDKEKNTEEGSGTGESRIPEKTRDSGYPRRNSGISGNSGDLGMGDPDSPKMKNSSIQVQSPSFDQTTTEDIYTYPPHSLPNNPPNPPDKLNKPIIPVLRKPKNIHIPKNTKKLSIKKGNIMFGVNSSCISHNNNINNINNNNNNHPHPNHHPAKAPQPPKAVINKGKVTKYHNMTKSAENMGMYTNTNTNINTNKVSRNTSENVKRNMSMIIEPDKTSTISRKTVFSAYKDSILMGKTPNANTHQNTHDYISMKERELDFIDHCISTKQFLDPRSNATSKRIPTSSFLSSSKAITVNFKPEDSGLCNKSKHTHESKIHHKSQHLYAKDIKMKRNQNMAKIHKLLHSMQSKEEGSRNKSLDINKSISGWKGFASFSNYGRDYSPTYTSKNKDIFATTPRLINLDLPQNSSTKSLQKESIRSSEKKIRTTTLSPFTQVNIMNSNSEYKNSKNCGGQFCNSNIMYPSSKEGKFYKMDQKSILDINKWYTNYQSINNLTNLDTNNQIYEDVQNKGNDPIPTTITKDKRANDDLLYIEEVSYVPPIPPIRPEAIPIPSADVNLETNPFKTCEMSTLGVVNINPRITTESDIQLQDPPAEYNLQTNKLEIEDTQKHVIIPPNYDIKSGESSCGMRSLRDSQKISTLRRIGSSTTQFEKPLFQVEVTKVVYTTPKAGSRPGSGGLKRNSRSHNNNNNNPRKGTPNTHKMGKHIAEGYRTQIGVFSPLNIMQNNNRSPGGRRLAVGQNSVISSSGEYTSVRHVYSPYDRPYTASNKVSLCHKCFATYHKLKIIMNNP